MQGRGQAGGGVAPDTDRHDNAGGGEDDGKDAHQAVDRAHDHVIPVEMRRCAESGGTAYPDQLGQDAEADYGSVDAPSAGGHRRRQVPGEEGEGEDVGRECEVELQGFLPDGGVEEFSAVEGGGGNQRQGGEGDEQGKAGEGGGIMAHAGDEAGVWAGKEGGHAEAPLFGGAQAKSRAHGVEGQKPGGAEQEDQAEIGQGEEVGHLLRSGSSDGPRADEQIKREVVDPPGKGDVGIGKKRHYIRQAAVTARCA